jgi:hypothetical protein
MLLWPKYQSTGNFLAQCTKTTNNLGQNTYLLLGSTAHVGPWPPLWSSPRLSSLLLWFSVKIFGITTRFHTVTCRIQDRRVTAWANPLAGVYVCCAQIRITKGSIMSVAHRFVLPKAVDLPISCSVNTIHNVGYVASTTTIFCGNPFRDGTDSHVVMQDSPLISLLSTSMLLLLCLLL